MLVFRREFFIIKKFDLAIIGAGPVGLFTANFAHLHGLKTIIFDSLATVGGQPELLYPFKKILDIPVFNTITGTELIKRLKNNILNKSTIKLNHRVNKIEKLDDGFHIDNEFLTKTVIIATGTGSFKPKKFPLKMNQEIEKKVHYYINDPNKYANQTVGVFGGGDSALDWAVELANRSQVKLIHRRKEFRGLESNVNKLKKLKNVEILTPYLPKKISLSDNQLTVELKETGSSEINYQKFDQIIVAYGFRADNRFVRNWRVNLKGTHITVGPEMNTNVPGIYAIGDAIDYEDRVPLIGLGFGEAQIAINAIMRKLFPEKTLTIHSTSI
ncbi:NAD(P)/FAD-dependent oxidoreductase [Lactobacillus acetotolerans]|uniref:NAD(P)/FAD-dependent oxidoreductase n=1 Tax=Lactobacillus acetotolerans TaxID=1600 RepID=UPI0009E7F090